MADHTEERALLAGGFAALAASACCLGPLVLVSLGLGGAWLANLRLLEPYRPWFIGIAVVALVFAYRRMFVTAKTCTPGQVCAAPGVNRYRVLFWVVSVLVLIAILFPWIAPLFY